MEKKSCGRVVRAVSFAAVLAAALLVMTGCPEPEPVQKIFYNTDGTTTIISEESGIGFVSTTGNISANSQYAGYAESYIDYLSGGKNIIYSFHAPAACEAKIKVRYAFWGTKSEVRVGKIIINGVSDDDWIYFPWTSKTGTDGNSIWQYSQEINVSLAKGTNQIRLHPVAAGVAVPDAVYRTDVAEADKKYLSSGNLPNIDSLIITAAGITEGANDLQFYTLETGSCSDELGTVSVDPVQEFYLSGASVALTAAPAAGYKFDSWTAKKGTASVPSRDSSYTVTVTDDFSFTARFIPLAAEQPAGLVGYGAIQDDNATSYTLTGGLGGAEYTVSSVTELAAALSADDYARVITVSGTLDNWGNPSLSYSVKSNTTIQSGSVQGHLRNIELKLAGDNIIIKNMKFSEVVASACVINGTEVAAGDGNDAIQINGARHIWIDHCEFYSSLSFPDGVTASVEAKDFYDGLLDMKNGSSFITVSNSYFHDHWKAVLCGSGDSDDNGDSEMRLTFYNNYFKKVNSRSPLIRYGKAHLYNNYWHGEAGTQIDSTVNARCGAEVLVENSYFDNCKYTIGFFYSTDAATTGKWNVSGNIFTSAPSVSSTTSWTPPYTYPSPAAAADLPSSIPGIVGPKFKQ